MSWFFYGDDADNNPRPKTCLKGRNRLLRKGVWLRVGDLSQDILNKIQKSLRPNEYVSWCVVCEMRPNEEVLLEFWCKDPYDTMNGFGERYNVCYAIAKENPEWICEGDLGRGYKAPKNKENVKKKSSTKKNKQET